MTNLVTIKEVEKKSYSLVPYSEIGNTNKFYDDANTVLLSALKPIEDDSTSTSSGFSGIQFF